MKIVFLCSCLEPGRDGVGDYTRRLAAELIRQGHLSVAISLNDKYISNNLNEIQESELTDVQVLRLPAQWSAKDQFKIAKKFVDDFDPDWISMQFVIFGFHHKGLPFGLGSRLGLFGSDRKWHIMFHELWIGMEIGASKKHFLWGNIQRQLIKSLIVKLKPNVIHTNTNLYQLQIKKLGFNAYHLALFGNIPKAYRNDKDLITGKTLEEGKPINLILFGHIHPNSPIRQFADEASAYAAKYKVEILLTIIGRCGSEQERWVNSWNAPGLKVNILGEQTPNYISKIFGNSTLGISTTPIALVGKSGSVAAMHEHGLTVLCVSGPWYPSNFEDMATSKGVVIYQKGNLESIFRDRFDPPVNNDVSTVANELVNSLLNSA